MDTLSRLHLYAKSANLMQAVDDGNLLARQAVLEMLAPPPGGTWQKLMQKERLENAREGKASYHDQNELLGPVLWAFDVIRKTPFAALQLGALVLDRDD